MQVVVIYNSKKKCLEVKGRKAHSYSSKPAVLKRSHAFEMGDCSWTNQTLVGKVDLDDVRSLEEKKSPRPKWKHQVKLLRKKGKFVNIKSGKNIDEYSPRVFLEDSKIFVL